MTLDRAERHARSGFSLIELLTVIAVLAILAGILFPIFITARESARIAACQSNLKQFGVAFELYLLDYDDVYPVPGGLVGDRNYWAQENGGGIEGYLKPSMNERKSVWVCPSFPGEWDSPFTPRSYGMNSYLRNHNPLPEYLNWPFYRIIHISNGLPRQRLKDPADTILLYEGIPRDSYFEEGKDEGYVYRCGDWTQVRGYHNQPVIHFRDADKPCHRGRNNYLMCDGHVVTMKPENYDTFRFPSPEQNLWFVERFR